MKLTLKSLAISFAIMLAAVSYSIASPAVASAASRDCDDNAVVHCGTLTLSELRDNYKGDVKALYTYFGITSGMIRNSDNIKQGYVTKSGDVLVGDNVIASNALTAGRESLDGSVSVVAGGTTFYERSPSVSFTSDRLEAFVFVDDSGKFLGAVIKSCGNPVKAVAKTTPSVVCTSVTVNKISRTEYTFTGKAEAKDGATILGYDFRVTGPSTDKSIPVRSNKPEVTTEKVSLETAGEYKVVLTVKTSLGDTGSDNCAAKFTVENAPKPPKPDEPKKVKVCDPETKEIIEVNEDEAGNYKPVDDPACQDEQPKPDVEEIASTGPADMAIGAAGLGVLTGAGYYFRASRTRLLDALRKQ